MSFDDAIKALSLDALKNVKDGHVIGLGSGRAATASVSYTHLTLPTILLV